MVAFTDINSPAARHNADHSVDLLLTARECAALLRVGLSTFRRYVANGLVPKPLKFGGTARWAQSEILAVVEAAKAERDGTAT